MRAAEVLNRYAKNERDFQGANLKGLNFRNQDLSGADFSRSDIRGTNFRGANLAGAKFVEVTKAGLSKRWILIDLIGCFLLSGGASMLLAVLALGVLTYSISTNASEHFVSGIAFVFALGEGWYFFVRKGVAGFAEAVALVFAGALAVIFAFAFAEPVTGAIADALVGAFAGAFSVAVTFAVAVAVAVAVTGTLAGLIIGTLIFIVTGASVSSFSPIIWCVASLLLLAQLTLAFWVAHHALRGESRYAWIYQVSIAWSSCGGTSFRDADLAYADFQRARLKNVDLRAKSLLQTVLTDVDPNINLAPTENTYLANRRVRDLVRTGQIRSP